MLALFKRMEGIFGQKWADQFRTEQMVELAINEWGLGLYGLTGDQIANGIDRCRKECKWPPSIAEFVQFAKASDELWQHKGPAYRYVARALPKPKPDPVMVRQNLKAMRSVLLV